MMTVPPPASPPGQSYATAGRLREFLEIGRNFDLLVLFLTVVTDVRLFKGMEFASFTIFEIFIWFYCTPLVLRWIFLEKKKLAHSCARFLIPVILYLFWISLSSLFAFIARSDSGVLQDTKNIFPVFILSLFIFLRVNTVQAAYFICNLYIFYSFLSCIVGIFQHYFGVPYFREFIEGTAYKLDIDGNIIINPVVGFSGHPNEFAMAILPGVTLSALMLIHEIKNHLNIRLRSGAAVFLMITGLFLSQARGASVFVLSALFFIGSRFGSSRSFLLKISYNSTIILFIVSYGIYKSRSDITTGDDTIETRLLLWKTSFDAIFSDVYVLFFGDGMPYVAKWSEQVAGWLFPDAHNAWIDQVLFFGFPAAILYFAIWREAFFLSEKSSGGRQAAVQVVVDGLRAALLALMGDYFFEPVAHAVFPLSELFLIMSLSVRVASFHAVDSIRVSPSGRQQSARRTRSDIPNFL